MVSVGTRTGQVSPCVPVPDLRRGCGVAHSNRTRDRACHSRACRDVDIRSPKAVDVLCLSVERARACCSAASVRLRMRGLRRGLHVLPVTPESALSCDTVPSLTIEFHSVPSGRGSSYPHPNRHPRSTAVPSLTVEFHRVPSGRGSSYPHPNRRPRSTAVSSLTVEFHSVPSGRGSSCPHPNRHPRSTAVPSLTVASHSVSSGRGSNYPHPNRHPRSIAVPSLTVANHGVWRCRGAACSHPDRRSPSKCTAFRVVAGWAVHTRIGILVRLRADAHHRNSLDFQCLVWAISKPVPAPRPATRLHAPTNAKAVRALAEAGPSTLKRAVPRRPDAPKRREGGRPCGYRAAESTRKPVHPTGEDERRVVGAGIRRCGYLPPTSTRRAVNFDGERRHPLEPRTDRGVDIRPPARLETLCNRMVSARASPKRSPGIVDIPHPRPIRTLCIRWVRARPFRHPSPCRTACERPPPRPRSASRAFRPFRGNPPAHPDTPRTAARHPARKISRFPTETCAVFLAPASSEQDEKKLSRLPAKK